MIDLQNVKNIIAKQINVNPVNIDDKATLGGDLRMNSKQITSLMSNIEAKFDISFSLSETPVGKETSVEYLAYLVKIAVDNKIPYDDSVLEA
ncbi:MAG: acyl carrier protein [Clostridia bacterium]|nr:acyl carrier protein [Clostridia bacterium]